jgi:hypothetical protein
MKICPFRSSVNRVATALERSYDWFSSGAGFGLRHFGIAGAKTRRLKPAPLETGDARAFTN